MSSVLYVLCLTAGRQRAACQINYKSIEPSARISCSVTSFEWIFSEGDRTIPQFFFLSHNIYPCLSFSMSKRLCVYTSGFYIYKYTLYTKGRNWEILFCFHKQLIQSLYLMRSRIEIIEYTYAKNNN